MNNMIMALTTPPAITQVQTENVPTELRTADCFLRWRYISKPGKKPFKCPVDASGSKRAHANTQIHLSFSEASKVAKDGSYGLGISLKENGLILNLDGTDQYVWCLDLDGFVELGGRGSDDEVFEILDRIGSYAEVSPSRTGLKVFFLSDKEPETKSCLKFSSSKFAHKHPEVRKYQHREVEVFSKGYFLTLTGEVCHEDHAEIRYLPETELDGLLVWLHEMAVASGGAGLTHRLKIVEEKNSDCIPTIYSKLTPESLDVVLKYVDHSDEQVWSDVANALARAYGEEAREKFIRYCRGDYADAEYAGFDLSEVNERFNRALREAKSRPDGYGVKHLIALAENHDDWTSPELSYEEDAALSFDVPKGYVPPQDLFAPRSDETSPDDRGPAPVSALSELQKKFCIIDLSGETRVIDREQMARVKQGADRGGINFYKKPDGELHMRRYLESLAITDKQKEAISKFWINPSTHVYNEIAFTPKPTPSTTLNYWSSYTVIPTKHDFAVISDFLFDVICDSNTDNFDYLLKFLAHMVQKPEEKPGVVVALLGGQGTGKGVFFSLLRAIWARTTLQVSDIDEVVGRFNAVLERNYVVCLDEAIFKGDGRSLDRLKSLVTEPVIRTEEKYQPSRSIESVHRFFSASNHSQIAKIERDDRRFFFLRISDIHQQDTDYFATMCESIEDAHVLGGLVHFLENLDLTGFDVRKRPQTAEHASQKLKSLQGFERYWHEVLSTGDSYAMGNEIAPWTIPVFRSTNSLMHAFKEFDKLAGRFAPVQQSEVAKTVKRVCPSAKPVRKMLNNKQLRGFDLPSMDVARKEFESYLGCAIDWEDEE